jgi:hypothetical protein
LQRAAWYFNRGREDEDGSQAIVAVPVRFSFLWLRARSKYNVFDMQSVIYRSLIENMFSEPAIKRGLGN